MLVCVASHFSYNLTLGQCYTTESASVLACLLAALVLHFYHESPALSHQHDLPALILSTTVKCAFTRSICTAGLAKNPNQNAVFSLCIIMKIQQIANGVGCLMQR
jgi:hypothetical protein